MFKSYFKVGWRNLLRDKGYSFINIGGLALGIAVTMLIGLWVHDELSFDKHNQHYHEVAAVMQNNTIDGVVETWGSQSYQLGPELRSNYGNYFKRVVMATFATSSILAHDEKSFSIMGTFMEADGPELLSLQMLHGKSTALSDLNSILLSEKEAQSLFGLENPVGKIIHLDNSIDLKVAGVYQNQPDNSSFRGELGFVAPLDIIVNRGGRNFGWVNNWLQVFVQLEKNVTMEEASRAIKDVKIKNVSDDDKRFKPALFLHPMSKWRLHSGFKNGVNAGGRIEYVWLFGSIGAFVLLLACINFMNLSTARSQKRSKEVGVRKVVGSRRSNLIGQFFTESLLVVAVGFVFAIVLAQISLPWFNEIAGKNIQVDWLNPILWATMASLVLFIAIISGSYPALYLSAFKPIKVLKGTFSVGRHASLPRKMLVVVQFTISVALVIGTIVVYQQIEFATSRPIGYNVNGLITIPLKTEEVKKNYNVFRNELLATGVFNNVSASETTVLNMWYSDWGFEWKGKDPKQQDHLYRGAIDYDFGQTVGWKIKQGRDFSREFASDSTGIIINEAALSYMGLKNPIGEIIRGYGKSYTVIGVVNDMVTQSLYEASKPTIFVIDPFNLASVIQVRMDPRTSAAEAIQQLTTVFTKNNPNTPFEYRFADDEFADKFYFEARVGKLVAIFAVLAIFISCLGLFGLASFIAEQRTKEIGIRKVMGASVARVWAMLSKDFVLLVTISCIIAVPLANYFMTSWLEQYDYRTPLHLWVFVVTCVAALLITLLTVSVRAIKAALVNPVNSLKAE